MKKILVPILIVALFLVLVSCGGNKATDSQSDTTSQADTSISSESEGKKVSLTLNNYSTVDLTSVSISKSVQDSSSKNLIIGTLKSGSNTTIKIKMPTGDEDQMYVVSAESASGEKYEFYGLDLSELTEEGGNIFLDLTEGGDGFANFVKP